MSTAQADAARVVEELLQKHFNLPAERRLTRDQFVQDVVVQLGRLMRPVAEEQVRSSGWISPDECREQSNRMVNAGIADYCRHRRQAIFGASETGFPVDMKAVLSVLAFDEAHYARLAKMPTHQESEDRIRQAVNSGGRVLPVPLDVQVHGDR